MGMYESDSENEVGSLGSDNKSNGETSSSNTSTKGTDEDIDTIKGELTKRETTAVFRLRITVLLVLFLAAAGVCVTVYILTRNAELEEFTIQYEGSAEKILNSFNGIFAEMTSISGLAVSDTAHSVDHNIPFPYMTMTNFQEKAGNARTLSRTLYVSISSFVTKEQLPAWQAFVLGGNNTWIDDGYEFQEVAGINGLEDEANAARSHATKHKVDPPHVFDEYGNPSLEVGDGPYLLRWQTSPVLKTSLVNVDLFQEKGVSEHAYRCLQTESATLSRFVTAPPGYPSHENMVTAFFATLASMREGKITEYLGDPMGFVLIPVYDTFEVSTRNVVAVMKSAIHWRTYFRNILPSNINGITVVLENKCDGFYTYELQGAEAYVVGEGDQHDLTYNKWVRSTEVTLDVLEDGTATGLRFNQGECPYSLHVYPTEEFYEGIVTHDPIIITFAVGMVFFFTIILFLFYDRLVERRQRLILAKATQSTAIVSSLFPKQIRDRLLQTGGDKNGKNASMPMAPNYRLKTFLSGNTEDHESNNQPIADLFVNCTVLFADIAGFTAWSSTREPAQVFVLLQTVYQAFDNLAKRRRVFKVETIGDSYVAVTGLPEPQSNHAIIMARFAWECLVKMNAITKELEVTLGPDTGDLAMRFGLHSGPVTAGVLRGERARFQLFGDTVNTASRMESTGVKNKIQISQATADHLAAAGKTHWLKPREDAVQAKGKGVLTTFWLNPSSRVEASVTSDESDVLRETIPGQNNVSDINAAVNDKKKERLVDWMVELLLPQIKKIVAAREATSKTKQTTGDIFYEAPAGATCLDEVKEVMTMPKFNAETIAAVDNHRSVTISPRVVASLKEYVSLIASTYLSNPFHNFEHACHVTMSVNKLLKRIVAPDLTSEQLELLKKGGGQNFASHLHDFTHGIVSDPMAAFAITFSAIIHDADHRGVSNMQLINEDAALADRYRKKSVAEQNSLDIAWDILMLDQFRGLRRALFGTQEELLRFRQLIVNIVLATDIFDKELNDLRRMRWDRAFSAVQPGQDVDDFRATIVMEHIIQASDVSHTMQHWHVYQKWNKNLFKEMYQAYKAGRMGSDPSTFWYNGELGFFDNYIIPLAKKLKECNVFGVSSEEYLNYALLNRAEWEQRGQDIVKEFLEEVSASS